MRLKHLWIKEFKNLKDFEITFDQDSPYTVLVGQNGSGKSNVLEALVRIFYRLERQKPVPFEYKLEYTSRSRAIEINGSPDRALGAVVDDGIQDSVVIGGRAFHRHAVKDEDRLLPEFIFGYYSGVCGRFQKPFDDYQNKYTQRLRTRSSGECLPRRFLYGSLSYAELILVSLWAHSLSCSRSSCILDAIEIKEVKDVCVTVQPPKKYDPTIHDPHSMGLRGVMREFVAELQSMADGESRSSGTGKERRDSQYFCQKGLMRLAAFAERRHTNLFNLLLQAQHEGILASLCCSIVLEGGVTISLDDLSEGEKQLLLVMGVLRFAEDDESLFLLDEPDTHLNPRWSLSYIDMIEKELGHAPKSYIIMATHNPLVLTDLKASQVRILRRAKGTKSVSASPPTYDPKEMGVDGLLTSELFDLNAPIGTEVQEMIYRRAVLLGKGDQRTGEETREMQNITQKLDRMGFARVFADPIYTKFVAAMGRRPEFMKPVLTPEAMAEQERFASEVLDEIMKEDSK